MDKSTVESGTCDRLNLELGIPATELDSKARIQLRWCIISNVVNVSF